MVRILFIAIIAMPALAHAYTHDEHMPIAPRPTTVKEKPIVVPSTSDAPISDIKPYEQTYDL